MTIRTISLLQQVMVYHRRRQRNKKNFRRSSTIVFKITAISGKKMSFFVFQDHIKSTGNKLERSSST